MHPYLFFYLLGGVTFIPLTLLVTIGVLWLRLPKLDKTMPRPTDMPTSYALPESTQGTNDAPSTTARDQYVDMENGGNGMRKRTKAGVETTSKSNHQLQKPILSSSTSIASRSPATSPPISLKASKDATMDSRNQGQSGHTTESEEEAEKDDIDDDNNGDDGDSDEDNHDSEEGENNDDDNDDNDGEDEDTIGDDTKDKLKDNEATSGTFGLKSTSTRTSNVPVQSDANFNREGYVRMTRVPRLGPSAETISDYMSNILFQPKNARPKDSYYAVLRYDTLFLYESDQQRDCKFVMQMTLHEVKIFPRNLPDNEVFNKEHPIQIKRRASAPASSSVPANSQDEYYIFIHTPVIKEDWFLALLHASRLRKPGMRQVRDKAQFDLQAIQNHLRILHSDKHHEHTRWFNSFLGRIFLGVYKTKRIQEVFIAKIKRKTLKLKRPSFLGEIKVRSFNIGQSIPYITRTKLNELATNGELTAEFHLDYRGGIRVEIEVDVGLGLASLKPVKVTIVLAVLVRSLSGMMTLKIKAPPTNRFWIGFQEPPEMDIVIEPIVADKAIKLNMVINAIETKIREAMVEAIVLPNMDDYPFFDSRGAGGIFEGDEEVPTESVEESDAESNVETTGRGSTTTAAGARHGRTRRRGSESSFGSEHAPPANPESSDRIHSWSSSADSDAEPESPFTTSTQPPFPSMSATGLYLHQQGSTTSTLLGGNHVAPANSGSSSSSSSTMSAVASKLKRLSQINFSSKLSATDSAMDTTHKLNTKPTVATSIATATRMSPSATSHHSNSGGSGRSMHSSKLQAVIPKLADLTSSESHGTRIFASSSPSHAPSKRTSTNSLKRLANMESPSVDENGDDVSDKDEDNDIGASPTKNDPLYQSLNSSRASSSKKIPQDWATGQGKSEVDTLSKSSSGLRGWDSMPSNSNSSGELSGSDSKNGNGKKDSTLTMRGTASAPTSTHVGIAGILENNSTSSNSNGVKSVGSSISQIQNRNKALLREESVTNARSSENGNGIQGNIDNHVTNHHTDNKTNNKTHERKSSGDSLLILKQKGDVFLKKITNRGNENTQDEATDGRKRDGDSTSSVRNISPRSLLRRLSIRSGAIEAGEQETHGEGDPHSTQSTSTTTNSEGSHPASASSSMSKSAFIQKKSQAAYGSAKAWVKRSLEDRRTSEDDPLLTGKMGW